MFLNRIFKQGSGAGFSPKDSKTPTQADRGTQQMDNHTLIITTEQKQLIIKALEKFSQLHLGQTSLEQRDAKKLEQLLARHKDSIVVDAVNSTTR